MRSLTGATSRKPYANSVKRRSGGRKSLGSAKKRKCATGRTLAKALLGIPASTECTPAAPGRGRSDSAIIGHRAPDGIFSGQAGGGHGARVAASAAGYGLRYQTGISRAK